MSRAQFTEVEASRNSCDKKDALERRKAFRYPTRDVVEVNAVPTAGQRLQAIVIDVSRSGVCLKSATPLTIHSEIEVLFGTSKLVIFGEVRYCRQTDGAFYSGIRIDAVVDPQSTDVHLQDDEIALYIAGKGLTTAEFLRVEEHLSGCRDCARITAAAAANVYKAARRLAPRRPLST